MNVSNSPNGFNPEDYTERRKEKDFIRWGNEVTVYKRQGEGNLSGWRRFGEGFLLFLSSTILVPFLSRRFRECWGEVLDGKEVRRISQKKISNIALPVLKKNNANASGLPAPLVTSVSHTADQRVSVDSINKASLTENQLEDFFLEIDEFSKKCKEIPWATPEIWEERDNSWKQEIAEIKILEEIEKIIKKDKIIESDIKKLEDKIKLIKSKNELNKEKITNLEDKIRSIKSGQKPNIEENIKKMKKNLILSFILIMTTDINTYGVDVNACHLSNEMLEVAAPWLSHISYSNMNHQNQWNEGVLNKFLKKCSPNKIKTLKINHPDIEQLPFVSLPSCTSFAVPGCLKLKKLPGLPKLARIPTLPIDQLKKQKTAE